MAGKKQKGKAFIGTSGWSYKHWQKTFYPEGTRPANQFAYYSDLFSTVEINNSFYKLPSRETLESWKKAAPPGFVFSVKGSRFITHMKKLVDPGRSFSLFFDRIVTLEEKLGPVLFQLPPRWKVNAERLREFCKILPNDLRCAFEFRDTTWYNKEITTILSDNHCAFCIYELNGHRSPKTVTADFVYVRLHGPGGKYEGSYDSSTLKQWAEEIHTWIQRGLDVYVYFDNDQLGYAANNARQLQELCRS